MKEPANVFLSPTPNSVNEMDNVDVKIFGYRCENITNLLVFHECVSCFHSCATSNNDIETYHLGSASDYHGFVITQSTSADPAAVTSAAGGANFIKR